MESIYSLISPAVFLFAVLIALIAGFVKGIVGFAMPMIMISGFASVMDPKLALAGLILPALVTNGMQAVRYGLKTMFFVLYKFKVFLGVGLIVLIISAQFVVYFNQSWLFILIGSVVTLFSVAQLLGWRPKGVSQSLKLDLITGVITGGMGGLSGIFGPSTVAYLTAIDTPKEQQIPLQGVIFGIGSFALLGAHLQSGVIRTETLPFSAALIIPGILGMWIGLMFQNKINQQMFRKMTLLVLIFAGANLIRRGLLAI